MPLVFTYGTLMDGGHNNARLGDGARLVGRAVTGRSGFVMVDCGYPYLVDLSRGLFTAARIAPHRARGEVWEVTRRALADCDRLEGFYGHGQDNHYDRVRVRVAVDGVAYRVWAYVASGRIVHERVPQLPPCAVVGGAYEWRP